MAAPPGNGKRNVNSLLMEMSFHLLEPIVNALLETAVTGEGIEAATVSSTTAMYIGAIVVVSSPDGTNANAVTLTAVNTAAGTISGAFTSAYAPGAIILGGTFSTQQPTDPFFTQSEVLNYIARAQNEFLVKVPIIFEFFKEFGITTGQQFYTLPPNAIELERVAIQTAINSGFGEGGFGEVPFGGGTGFGDGGFGEGPFGGGGTSSAVYTRLYEVTQSEIAMRNPQWFFDQVDPTPTGWYEDRTGIYGFGLADTPASNFVSELICSIRDDESMALTDHFLVPDIMLHGVKWKALQYCWDKDGEQRSPSSARAAGQRFDRLCVVVDRYLRGFVNATQGS